MAQIELYHFWDSFCSFKVRICLEEKGLPWTGHHIDLMAFENLKPDYLAVNEKAVVPTLRHDGSLIPESSIINEFLDDRYPEPALKPTDPLARARMRYWVKVEEDELFTAVRPASLNLMMKQAFAKYSESRSGPAAGGTSAAASDTDAEKDVARSSGPESSCAVATTSRRDIGEDEQGADGIGTRGWPAKSYSLADIAAAPVIDRIQRLNMADLWSNLPALEAWVERVISRPAYRKAAPPERYRMPSPIAQTA